MSVDTAAGLHHLLPCEQQIRLYERRSLALRASLSDEGPDADE
jgi:hypothetical protein